MCDLCILERTTQDVPKHLQDLVGRRVSAVQFKEIAFDSTQLRIIFDDMHFLELESAQWIEGATIVTLTGDLNVT